MEIREVTTYNEKSPISGYGIWIIFELRYRKAQLIHPIYFTELILSEYEYVRSCGGSLWPINTTNTIFKKERFIELLKQRIKFYLDNDRSFPVQIVAKILSELEETPVQQQLDYIESINMLVSAEQGKPTLTLLDKANISYCLNKQADISGIRGRPLAIVEALKDSGPVSIYQITHLVNGRLKTKSDLSRVVTYFVHKLASQGILEVVV